MQNRRALRLKLRLRGVVQSLICDTIYGRFCWGFAVRCPHEVSDGTPRQRFQRQRFSLPSASRRSFLSLSAAASAALALRIVTEPMLAHARVHSFPKDAIRLDANENPLGPSASAREAIAAIVPQGGRYSD